MSDAPRILIVEDSPRLLPMMVEQAGVTFRSQKIDMLTEGRKDFYEYPEVIVHHCHTLEQARGLLRHYRFDGAVVDIGFPRNDITERLSGNRSGLELLGELRRGLLGENQDIPVAVTSVEHVHAKLSDFMDTHPDKLPRSQLGRTQGFFKGGRKPGTENMNVFNSTIPTFERTVFAHANVAEEPMKWLKREIDRARMPEAEPERSRKHAGQLRQRSGWFSRM